MTAQIRLPGRAEPLVIPEPGWAASYPPPTSRRVYAAAHVAASPGPDGEVIDWEATMRFRDHLWAHGFGVAEAMDTAQRGMGLAWEQARELIARSAQRAEQIRARLEGGAGAGGSAGQTGSTGGGGDAGQTGSTEGGGDAGQTGSTEGGGSAGQTGSTGGGGSAGQTGSTGGGGDSAQANGARDRRGTAGRVAVLACGAGTDQLPGGGNYSISTITDAYAEQMAFVQATGADVILMASRALAASARGARDYLEVYGELLRQADRPVILHWLGEAFDPGLRGYWGSAEFGAAADTVLELIERADGAVDGVKLSLLDADREVALRRRLPAGVRLYTGDDFHYAGLIRGDAEGHSDALLGAFAAVTVPAAAALAALEAGDVAGYDAAMGPTVPLSRAIFEPPTYHYKVGVAFLAWLNGLQPHFAMLGGLQRRRPARHLIRVFELAAAARALADPELAAGRMTRLLATIAGPERV